MRDEVKRLIEYYQSITGLSCYSEDEEDIKAYFEECREYLKEINS